MSDRIIEAEPSVLRGIAELLEQTYTYVIDRTDSISGEWLSLSEEFKDADTAQMRASFIAILKELKGSLPLGMEAANLLRNYADWLETK